MFNVFWCTVHRTFLYTVWENYLLIKTFLVLKINVAVIMLCLLFLILLFVFSYFNFTLFLYFYFCLFFFSKEFPVPSLSLFPICHFIFSWLPRPTKHAFLLKIVLLMIFRPLKNCRILQLTVHVICVTGDMLNLYLLKPIFKIQ